MERMIGAGLALRSQRREAVGAAGLGLEVTTDLTWLSAAWRKHVLPKALVAASPGWIHRKYFELAVLAQVKDELKSGDLYIPHGERYDDYREQLVDEATRSEEHTSELQSLMRISYAVFCLKKKTNTHKNHQNTRTQDTDHRKHTTSTRKN